MLLREFAQTVRQFEETRPKVPVINSPRPRMGQPLLRGERLAEHMLDVLYTVGLVNLVTVQTHRAGYVQVVIKSPDDGDSRLIDYWENKVYDALEAVLMKAFPEIPACILYRGGGIHTNWTIE